MYQTDKFQFPVIYGRRRVGKAAIDFLDLGRHWGTNPKTRKQFEIDIMGTADNDTALFAECKWRNEKVDLEVLETSF